MARDFIAASSQYLSAADNSIFEPSAITLHGWFAPDINTSGVSYGYLSKRENGVSNQYQIWKDTVANNLYCHFWCASGNSTPNIAYSPTLGAWENIIATYDTTNGGTIRVNNGTPGTAAAKGAINSGNGELRIGEDHYGNYYDGGAAEIAIWNRVLSAGEMALLSAGYSPLFIPYGLVHYAPLLGRHSPEIDLINKGEYTITGAGNRTHPRIIMPSRYGNSLISSATNVTESIPSGLLSLTPGTPRQWAKIRERIPAHGT